MAGIEIDQDGLARLTRTSANCASELQVAGDSVSAALLALTAASGMNNGGSGLSLDRAVWTFVDARLESVALMASHAENLRTATENAVGALIDVDRQLAEPLTETAPGQG